jgi:hypothetical protein
MAVKVSSGVYKESGKEAGFAKRVNRFAAFKRPIEHKSDLRYVPTGNPRFLRLINRQRCK